MEILRGYMAVFLNLDELIAIIRREDEPRPVIMAHFDLTEVQAEAILNMRLRALRRLEEEGILKEYSGLEAEQAELAALIDSPSKQRYAIRLELDALRKRFGKDTVLGARRTMFGEAAVVDMATPEALIEVHFDEAVARKDGARRALAVEGDNERMRHGRRFRTTPPAGREGDRVSTRRRRSGRRASSCRR